MSTLAPIVQRPKRSPSLEKAMDMVGGRVEIHDLPDGSQLLYNGEGTFITEHCATPAFTEECQEIERQLLCSNRQAFGEFNLMVRGPVIHLKGKARWL